jgi:hypothetical protein
LPRALRFGAQAPALGDIRRNPPRLGLLIEINVCARPVEDHRLHLWERVAERSWNMADAMQSDGFSRPIRYGLAALSLFAAFAFAGLPWH